MDSGLDFWDSYELLKWQIEFGADEAIHDAPINRYELIDEIQKKTETKTISTPPIVPEAQKINVYVEAEKAAKNADNIEALLAAIKGFDHCDLRKGAKNCIICAGNPAARVMIVTAPPSREDDRNGNLMSGHLGVFFDKMFAAVDLSRDSEISAKGLYLVSVLPWCPPATSGVELSQLKMMVPFLKRHIELAAPEVVVAMGNSACQVILEKSGTTRLRGNWEMIDGRPILPMMEPQQIMKNPRAKRHAWADLLSLKTRLTKGS